MTNPNYLVYFNVNGYKTSVEVSTDSPEKAIELVSDLFKEIEGKVANVRVADPATGYFLRGFDK